MQAIRCPICSSQATESLDFASRQGDRRFPVRACGECGHRFIENPPGPEELAELYDRYYASDRRQQRQVRTAPRDRALARTLVPHLPVDARVLEVGCNFGETLLAFPRSYRLEGIDLSASAARAAAANRRLQVRQGFFESEEYAPGAYDCFISLAVIEHIRDPLAFLRKAAAVLKPGGMLVMMTGDHGSWYARRKGERWSLYHSVGHLHFFNRESLERALVLSGFAPTEWLWAGPTPLSSRLPGPLGRLLHCQTTSLLFPGLQARRRYGSNVYCWARRGPQAHAAPASSEAA